MFLYQGLLLMLIPNFINSLKRLSKCCNPLFNLSMYSTFFAKHFCFKKLLIKILHYKVFIPTNLTNRA